MTSKFADLYIQDNDGGGDKAEQETGEYHRIEELQHTDCKHGTGLCDVHGLYLKL